MKHQSFSPILDFNLAKSSQTIPQIVKQAAGADVHAFGLFFTWNDGKRDICFETLVATDLHVLKEGMWTMQSG